MTDRFNPRGVTADNLGSLSDSEFRAVVDADLRRRVRPEGLPEDVANALRTAAHVERWHSTLDAIRISVEGQLVAAADEYEALRSVLEADIRRLEAEGASPTRLDSHYTQENQLRTDYLSKKAGRERFLTGVQEHLAQATLLRDTRHLADTDDFGRIVLRVRKLERAIEAHRRAVVSDLNDGEQPEMYEETLWAVLADG